jgi:hypothetical protein
MASETRPADERAGQKIAAGIVVPNRNRSRSTAADMVKDSPSAERGLDASILERAGASR